MPIKNNRTSVWVDSKYVLGGVLMTLYNYDEVGRISSVSTMHLTRRDAQRIVKAIDLHDDDHAQDELPF